MPAHTAEGCNPYALRTGVKNAASASRIRARLSLFDDAPLTSLNSGLQKLPDGVTHYNPGVPWVVVNL
jgi:hypothetical protein